MFMKHHDQVSDPDSTSSTHGEEGRTFGDGAMNLFPVFPERDPQQWPFCLISFFKSGSQDWLSTFSCGLKSAEPVAAYY